MCRPASCDTSYGCTSGVQEKQKALNKAYEEMESWRKKVEATKAKAEGLRAKQVCNLPQDI